MNLFDPVNNCPRCGHGSNKTEFCARTNNCGIDHDTPLQHRICWECGYRWSELPREIDISRYNAWLEEVNRPK